jgi:hypothetical protein
LPHVGEVNCAGLAGDVFNLLDTRRERELRIAQISDGGAS